MSVERKMLRARAQSAKYDKDPPSVKSTGQPIIEHSMFDLDRLAQAMAAGKVEGIPAELPYPNDNLLAATVVSLGMPAFAADQVRYHPGLRLAFVRMWSAVQLAAEGHRQAQEVVDICRQSLAEQRKAGTVTDRPDMSVGLWER